MLLIASLSLGSAAGGTILRLAPWATADDLARIVRAAPCSASTATIAGTRFVFSCRAHNATDAAVLSAEADSVVRAHAPLGTCKSQSAAPWGLARVSSSDPGSPGTAFQYAAARDGEGVAAYVVDSGVFVEHDEFQGRARWGPDFAGPAPAADRNGHGTHVAGVIAGARYGVAKGAEVVAVKVLRDDGSGLVSDVIRGIEFACADHADRGNRCVVNLSIGAGHSAALNGAIAALVQCGCAVAYSAGNDGADACAYSPASASKGMAVGAAGRSNSRAYFSNFGPCVDIFAPGVDIISAGIDTKHSAAKMSGTSMAAPHVAGVLASAMSGGLDASAAMAAAAEAANVGYLSSIGSGSPNKLAFWRSC